MQYANILFYIKLKVVNEALESDGDNDIDYSHKPQVFIPLSPSFESNLSFFSLLFIFYHKLNIKYLSKDS